MTSRTFFVSPRRARAFLSGARAVGSPISPNSRAARKRVVQDGLVTASMSGRDGVPPEIEEGVLGALPDAPMTVGHGLEERQDGFRVKEAPQDPGRLTADLPRSVLEAAEGGLQDPGLAEAGCPQDADGLAPDELGPVFADRPDEVLDRLFTADFAQGPDGLEPDVVGVVLEREQDPGNGGGGGRPRPGPSGRNTGPRPHSRSDRGPGRPPPGRRAAPPRRSP